MVEHDPPGEGNTPFDTAFKYARRIHDKDPKAVVTQHRTYAISRSATGEEQVASFIASKNTGHSIHMGIRLTDGHVVPFKIVSLNEGNFDIINLADIAIGSAEIHAEYGLEEVTDITGDTHLHASEERKEATERMMQAADDQDRQEWDLGYGATSDHDVISSLLHIRKILSHSWPASIEIPDGIEVKGPPTEDTKDLFRSAIEAMATGKKIKSECEESEDVKFELDTEVETNNGDKVILTRNTPTTTAENNALIHHEVWEFTDGEPVQFYEYDSLSMHEFLSLTDEQRVMPRALHDTSIRKLERERKSGDAEATTDEISRGLRILEQRQNNFSAKA